LIRTSKFKFSLLFHWNFDFSSNHSIISISQFEFLPEKFFVCVNSYLPWNYFNVSIFRWSLCHFYEIIRLLLCFFSDLYFPPKISRKNIRSASGFFIAGIPFVKNPGISFLHFRLRWCSLTWKRSCFAILGEISWKRSTYRLKFEHGQIGKCLRNSLIRQCHM
jgi:hypothetical protein